MANRILAKGNFSNDVVNYYASKNDFRGLAGYISQYKFGDATVQAQANQLVSNLNRYGELMNAVINASSQENRDKLSFYFKNKIGNYGATNDQSKYDRRYLDNINNIGNKGDKQADYIEYTFDNITAFNKFQDKYGKVSLVDPTNRQSGYSVVNGKQVLRIYKDDFKNSGAFSSLTNALNETTDFKKPVRGYATSQSSSPVAIFTTEPQEYNSFSSASYDKDGNMLVSGRGLMKEQVSALQQTVDAEKVYSDIMKNMNNTLIPSQLMIKGYICQQQAEITNRVMSGQMEPSIANFGLKAIDDYYKNELAGCSLTQYDVYSTEGNPETHNMNEITDPNKKVQLTEELRSALKEGRCKYSAASAGGRVGTVITLSAALDTDGKPKGNFKEGIQFFVPGLLEQDAREVMERDPEAAVTVKRGEHMAFNHAYELLTGGRLIDFQNDGSAVYENGAGRVLRTPEEVHQDMLENEMLMLTQNELLNDQLKQDLSPQQLTELATNYATKIFMFNNNIQSQEQLEKIDQDALKQGISKYVNLLLGEYQ